MTIEKYRVMILGDRRLAYRVIKKIKRLPVDKFKIVCLVTTPEFYADITPYINYKVNFIDNSNRNTKSIIREIDDNKINFLLSLQHKWILPNSILSRVEIALNLHNAKLPDYKGYNSISHAIINKEKSFTSTIAWMNRDVDEGDIAYEASVPILNIDNAASLYFKSLELVDKISDELFSDLINSRTPKRITQGLGPGKFYSHDSLMCIKNHHDKVLALRAQYFPHIKKSLGGEITYQNLLLMKFTDQENNQNGYKLNHHFWEI
jgi:methionyl-tRNA formyltransferase